MLDATPDDLALAHAALREITTEATIGDPVGVVDEGNDVVSVLFATTMPGYRGWNWTVSIARLPGEEPAVLETELMPGDGALLSPDWIPWVDRLADYRAAQEAAGLATDESGQPVGTLDALADDDDLDDDDLDDDDLDDDDDDDLDDDDLDGVDIDAVDLDDVDLDDVGLTPLEVGVDDPDQTEAEAGNARPEPPSVAAGKKWAEDGQEHD
jgi:hypothetical protein